MSRESDDGFTCGICLCTIERGECACSNEELAEYAERQRVKLEVEACLLRLGILPLGLAQKYERPV